MIKKIIVLLLLISGGYFIYQAVQPTESLYEPAQTKIIIIGGTSGIGKALALECADRGYTVGITGRRQPLLTAIQKEIGNKLYARYMDVARPDEARALLQSLVHEMGGVDIVVVNAGTGTFNMSWQAQKQILDVNVIGFTAMVTAAAEYFTQKGEGHIVGVSSIAALKGFAQAPAYSASKAFESNYLEGLRGQFKKKALPILVTTVEPGAVDTAMYKGTDFWRATPEKAAEQICDAIENGKEHVYITKRWRLVAWIFKLLPTPIFHKIF